jgi:hypothetical protein
MRGEGCELGGAVRCRPSFLPSSPIKSEAFGLGRYDLDNSFREGAASLTKLILGRARQVTRLTT